MRWKGIRARVELTLLGGLALWALASLVLAGCAEARTRKAPAGGGQPNIVVVMTDDQRGDTLTQQLMPQTWARFVENGVRFPNAFATTALCCPARAGFLTGDLASVHGVTQNNAALMVGPDAVTLATRLDGAGYRTGLFGKYLNQYAAGYVPPGWDVWHALIPTNGYFNYDLAREDGTAEHYGGAEGDYITDVLSTKLGTFIDESVNAMVPFFAFVTPPNPHVAPIPSEMVAPRHEGTWASLPPYRERAWAEADMSDKASNMQALPLLPGVIDTTDNLRILQLESLLAVDELMGALYAKLVQRRIRRDTLVVFTSDQGLFWYEHRLTGKNRPYDEAHRVPLVVSYPRALGLGARVEAGLVTHQDVCASLAAWAGVVAPGAAGMSFAAPLAAGLPLPRTVLPLEGWAQPDGTLLYTGTRTATHKWVTWHLATGQEYEEYDLENDPFELESLQ